MVNSTILSIAACVLYGLAIMLNFFRLLFRLKIRRLWWEDMWAAVVFVWGLLLIIVTVIYFETDSYEAILIAGWIASYTFTSIVWSVRMSLLYSIIRIVPPSTIYNVMRVIGVVFVMVWAILVALKTRWCVDNTKPALGRPACLIPHAIAIFEVTSDCVADATLVFISLKLLWRVRLPSRQRRMILSLFSSGAIMSFFSLIHAITQLVPVQSVEYVFTDLELASSLIVCNLLVVVTYVYRVLRNKVSGEGSSESQVSTEDDDFTTPIPTSTQVLTTVDLNTLDTTQGVTNASVVSQP